MPHELENLPPQLEPFSAEILRTKLPHVAVTPIIGRTAPWDSKLRGVPYYPKSRAWPTDPQGKPLVMLVQINFAEMPPLAGYPNDGILQLYISADYDENVHFWGMRIDAVHRTERERLTDQSYFRAVYFAEVSRDGEQLIRETPSVEFDKDYGFPAEDEARLEFASGSGYVRPDDYRFRRVFGKDRSEFFDYRVPGMSELQDAYEKFMGGLYYGTRIGGYSRVEQTDPRLEVAAEDWLVLFSLDTYANGEYPVGWGSGGIGNFYVPAEDLAKRDFSRVMYYWDFG